MNHRTEIAAMIDQVKSWPVEDRVALAYEILRDMRRQPLRAPPRNTLELARTLPLGAAAPPSDAEVKRWIEEERLNKYGE